MQEPRDLDPEKIFLCTIRTAQAAIWMVPNERLKNTLGGILARYQELLGIAIYAYAFLGNHLHILARAPRGNLDEFMENINREISRRVNFINQRKGTLWAHRYLPQHAPNPEDMLDALLYVATNPVKHGLVLDPIQWPGLLCYQQLLTEEEHSYPFTHFSKRDPEDPAKFLVTNHTLRLTPLPQFANLPKTERTGRILVQIKRRLARIIKDRRAAGKEGYMGSEALRKQAAGSIPEDVANSKRPKCYSKNPWTIKLYRRQARLRRAEFSKASLRYRLGEYSVAFPEWSHKPPLHRKPRKSPFLEFALNEITPPILLV